MIGYLGHYKENMKKFEKPIKKYTYREYKQFKENAGLITLFISS